MKNTSKISTEMLDKFCRVSSACLAIAVILFTFIYLIPKRDFHLLNETINYMESFTDSENNKVNIWNFKGSQEGYDIFCTAKDILPGSMLLLRTQNTFVDIYMNDELIYSDDRSFNEVGLESNGIHWKKLPLRNIDNSANIRITCYPCYDDNRCSLTNAYIGSSDACIFRVLMENLPATLISVFFTMLAIMLLTFFVYLSLRKENARDFLFVGIAILTTSLWSVLDTGIFTFTWGNSSHFQLLSDVFFLLIPLSFGLICAYRSEGKYKLSLCLFVIICEINLLVSFMAFFIGGVDFYHTKWTTIILNILAIPLLSKLVFTYQNEEKTKTLRNNVVILTFLFILLACAAMWFMRLRNDFNYDKSYLYRTSIICFNVCIICYHSTMANALFKKKYKASILHDFQLKDRVTGFFNRTALTENASKYTSPVQKSTVSVAFFRLRHVKMINETYGYEKGTSILQEFTSIVKSSFPDNCDFYRIGNRRFYVMIPNNNANEVYADGLIKIENHVKEINDFRSQPYAIEYDTSFVGDSNVSIFDLIDIVTERANNKSAE